MNEREQLVREIQMFSEEENQELQHDLMQLNINQLKIIKDECYFKLMNENVGIVGNGKSGGGGDLADIFENIIEHLELY